MNTEAPTIGPSKAGLRAVHKQWAIATIRKLRLIHPELTLTLYGGDWTFTIHVANCDAAAFPALVTDFDRNIRPASCHIVLSQQPPQVSVRIEEVVDYEAELWLNGEPLSSRDFNILLLLAEPDLPAGGIDFDNTRDSWIFRSSAVLTDKDRVSVQRAATKVGLVGPIEFVQESPPRRIGTGSRPHLETAGGSDDCDESADKNRHWAAQELGRSRRRRVANVPRTQVGAGDCAARSACEL